MNSYAMTNNVKEALKSAVNLAYSLGESQVGTEHLLYGLSNVPSSVASEILNSYGATANVILSFIFPNHINISCHFSSKFLVTF